MSKGILALASQGANYQAVATLNHPRLTAPQIAFVSLTAKKALWRGGNTIGKSYAHAWDLIHFARGTHPYRKCPRGPREIMVAGYSFAQMDPLLKKLWSMLPKDEIDPRLYYQPGNGILGFKNPTIPFTSGPGKGSVIYLATYEQGAERIMGFQGHRLSLDEPPPEEIYSEAVPRLNSFGGELRVTMTPTPTSPPLKYLQDIVEAGDIVELQTDYTEESCTITNGLIPYAWRTQAEVDADIAGYLADEREMRRTGAWTQLIKGRWLELVGEHCYVRSDFPRHLPYRVAVGIDHGARPGRQSATLVVEVAGEIWILDEARTGTATSVDEDAANILAMLGRWNIPWQRVDLWMGDRATSESFWGDAKSNKDLQAAIAVLLRMTAKEAAARGLRIRTVKKGPKSVRYGTSKINTLAKNGLLKIHSRAVGFRKCAQEWTGDISAEVKDPFDSARYAIMTLLDRRQTDAPRQSDYIGS